MLWILSEDGGPFRDRDEALRGYNRLRWDLSPTVDLEIQTHPLGGYGLVCVPPEPSEKASVISQPNRTEAPALRGAQWSSEGATSATATRSAETKGDVPELREKANEPSPQFPESFRLRPAIRAFHGHVLIAVFGLYLVLRPDRVIALLHVAANDESRLMTVLRLVVMFAGGLIGLMALLRVFWSCLSNRYLIDATGVVQIRWQFEKGALRRRAPRINFAQLRTVALDQDLTQMFLNVGTLVLASGGTDRYEVQLWRVSSPQALQTEILRRTHPGGGPAPNGSSTRERRA